SRCRCPSVPCFTPAISTAHSTTPLFPIPLPPPPPSTLFPYTTLFRSIRASRPARRREESSSARAHGGSEASRCRRAARRLHLPRSEEHTSELQSPDHLVCRLLLEKKERETPAAGLAVRASPRAGTSRR